MDRLTDFMIAIAMLIMCIALAIFTALMAIQGYKEVILGVR